MARVSTVQSAFDGGELSSLLLARTDIDRYKSSLFDCLNAIPLVQGPWQRRSAFAYLSPVKYHDSTTRVVPFQYSTTQAYILEFGPTYIRFFLNHGILTQAAKTITAITQAQPGVVTSAAHGFTNGQRLYLSGFTTTGGMTELSNRVVLVQNVTTDTFELWELNKFIGAATQIDTSGYDAYVSGGQAALIFEVTTPYGQADIAGLRFSQSVDSLYITHPSYPPYKLTRSAPLTWSLSALTFTDGPYDVVNTSVTTLTPGNATNPASTAITGAANNGSNAIRITAAAHGYNTDDRVNVEKVKGTTEANGYWKVTKIDANNFDLQGSTFTNTYTSGGDTYKLTALTSSDVAGINGGLGFLTTDVGRLIRIQEGTTWGYVVVAFYDSAAGVWVDILSTLTNTNAKANFRMGIYSGTTGYPSVSTFHEDRLYFANTAIYPQRVDGSRTSNYTNFSPSATDGTVSDSHAVSANLNSDDVNAVRWLSSHDKALLAGTSSAEWEIKATTLGQPITPSTTSFRPVTRRGSENAAPVVAGRATLFIQRAARKVREMVYAFDVDGYKTPDMTQLALHVTSPSLQEIVYTEQPQPILWGRRGDGALAALTYDRDSNSIGWHRHELGGQSSQNGGSVLNIPLVESEAVVLSPDASHSELYVVVQRWINGEVRRYIEYLAPQWEEGNEITSAFYFDAGWTQIDSPATAELHGLWHLEGETLPVFVDGAIHPDVTVTNGKVTLNYAGSIKTIGYAYNSDGQTLPIDAGSQDGSATGKEKKIYRLGLWLLDTLGLQTGPDFDNLTEILNNQFGQAFGSGPPLFTGIVRDMFPGDFDRAPQVSWRAAGPFPATVLAVMAQLETSDDS